MGLEVNLRVFVYGKKLAAAGMAEAKSCLQASCLRLETAGPIRDAGEQYLYFKQNWIWNFTK